MTTDTEQLIEAEEIYLTENEFEHWFAPSYTQPDILPVEGTPMLLQDRVVYDDYNHPDQFPGSKLRIMIDRAYGKPAPAPPPKPEARKLTRGADAVWTLFRCGNRVIAVNEDGSVAVKYVADPLDGWKMRIALTGALTRRGREASQEDLAMPGMDDSIRQIQSEVKVWVKCGNGRRMPRGITRLLKHIAEARKIYPPLTNAEIDAACDILEALRE